MTRKILFSPGYGAGWSTWNDDSLREMLCTWQPIIDFIEAGNRFTREECEWKYTKAAPDGLSDEDLHPLLRDLATAIDERAGKKEYTCFLGAPNLRVVTVEGDVRIDEYDGNESLITRYSDDGWF